MFLLPAGYFATCRRRPAPGQHVAKVDIRLWAFEEMAHVTTKVGGVESYGAWSAASFASIVIDR